MKPNPSGPSDQIACELLSLYFIERPKRRHAPSRRSSRPPTAAGSLDLAAERIEARGNPAVVTAPSQKRSSPAASGSSTTCRPTRSRWTAAKRSFCNRVRTKSTPAASTTNRPAGSGRLGRVVAQGPGWLRGQSAERPDQQLEADLEGPIAGLSRQAKPGDLVDRRRGVEVSGRGPASGAGDLLLARWKRRRRRSINPRRCARSHVGPP